MISMKRSHALRFAVLSAVSLLTLTVSGTSRGVQGKDDVDESPSEKSCLQTIKGCFRNTKTYQYWANFEGSKWSIILGFVSFALIFSAIVFGCYTLELQPGEPTLPAWAAGVMITIGVIGGWNAMCMRDTADKDAWGEWGIKKTTYQQRIDLFNGYVIDDDENERNEKKRDLVGRMFTWGILVLSLGAVLYTIAAGLPGGSACVISSFGAVATTIGCLLLLSRPAYKFFHTTEQDIAMIKARKDYKDKAPQREEQRQKRIRQQRAEQEQRRKQRKRQEAREFAEFMKQWNKQQQEIQQENEKEQRIQAKQNRPSMPILKNFDCNKAVWAKPQESEH